MRTKYCLLITLLFTALATCSAQFDAPTAIYKTITDKSGSSVNDSVFYFQSISNATINCSKTNGDSYVWMQYNSTTQLFDKPIASSTTHQLTVTEIGGYQVTIKNGTTDLGSYRCWAYSADDLNPTIKIGKDTCETFTIDLTTNAKYYDEGSKTEKTEINFFQTSDWNITPTLDNSLKIKEKLPTLTITPAPFENAAYSLALTYQTNQNYTTNTIEHKAKNVLAAFKDSVALENPDNVNISITGKSAPYAVNFINESKGNEITGYKWEFGNAAKSYMESPNFVFTKPDEYLIKLYIINKNGCSDSADVVTINIEGDKPEGFVQVPNVFTPNNDGKNDVFKVAYYSVKTFEMTILNKWGRKVYETTIPSEGWDGKINGKDADTGTYYYNIKAEGFNSEKYDYSGYLTLLRPN